MPWWIGAIVLLAIGMALEMGLLVYAMYVLLGVMLVSRFLARQWIESLSAFRECSRDAADVGDRVAVVVRLKNNGSLPIPWLIVEDALPKSALQQLPPRLKVDGRRMEITALWGGSEQNVLYQFTCLMRGYYQVGPLLLETGDVFGLHRRFKIATDPAFVLVYPKVVPLAGYNFASRRPIGEVRITHRLFEDPSRINGVRMYQSGDPLNRVHWKATARTGVLHSKTFEPSSVAGMTLLLDFHRESYPVQGEPHRSELAVTTVASLAHAVYQMGEQIGLVTNGRDAVDRIREEGPRVEFRTRADARADLGMRETSDRLRPVVVSTRRGADQFQRIRETLARVELTDGLTVPQLIGEVQSSLPRDATVTAVLGVVNEATAVALGSLRRQGYAVSVILTLSEDVEFQESAGLLRAEGLEVRRVEDEATLTAICEAELIG